MEPTYYLWNTANGGWLTEQGNYASSISEAKTFAQFDALAMTRRAFVKHSETYGLLPVNANDLTEHED